MDESFRTLKSGGIFCNMDIFDPGKGFMAPAFRFYFYSLVPPLMNMATQTEAYTYLANSVRNFVTPNRFVEIMKETGYENIESFSLGAGSVYIHRGTKP